MLTFTALFVFFAFNRLLHNIFKFAKTEFEIESIKNGKEWLMKTLDVLLLK
jgi:hypothetical protein